MSSWQYGRDRSGGRATNNQEQLGTYSTQRKYDHFVTDMSVIFRIPQGTWGFYEGMVLLTREHVVPEELRFSKVYGYANAF